MTDEANLQTAKINLGYTDIIAPIAGKIGRTNVTKGNVVGPDSGVADHDRQPGSDVCDRSRSASASSCKRNGRPARTRCQEHQGRHPLCRRHRPTTRSGEINFVDVTVDRATDTVIVRATFPTRKAR